MNAAIQIGNEAYRTSNPVSFNIRAGTRMLHNFPYNQYVESALTPEETHLVIWAANRKITIVGRNLGILQTELSEQRLSLVGIPLDGTDAADWPCTMERIEVVAV